MTDDEFQHFVDSAMTELSEKQERLKSEYGLGTFARWYFDQTTEKLEFFDAGDTKVVEAVVVDIGSYASNSSTWKWAWANDSVLPSLREKTISLRTLADLTGISLFAAESPVAIEDENMAWELAAMGVRHLGALGAYRAHSSGKPLATFLAIMSVSRPSTRN